MLIKTKSGSEYQLDIANKRIRRLGPTVRSWQTYDCHEPIVLGRSAVIYWRDDDPKYSGLRMITSPVVLVISDSQEKTNA